MYRKAQLKKKKGKRFTTMTNTQSLVNKLQMTSFVLMAAGSGWSDGNFTQGLPLWNMLIHCIPLVLLLVLALQIFRVRGTQQRGESNPRGAIIWMSILATVSIIASVALIVLGIVNPDPNSVGVHNLWDWFPTIVMNAGNLLWLATLVPARRAHTEVSMARNN